MNRHVGAITVALCIILSSLAIEHYSFASERYVFGVVPQFEQRKLFAVWQPIIKELEKRTKMYGEH